MSTEERDEIISYSVKYIILHCMVRFFVQIFLGLSEKDNSKGVYYGYMSPPSQGSGGGGSGTQTSSYSHNQMSGSNNYYPNSSGANNTRNEVRTTTELTCLSSVYCVFKALLGTHHPLQSHLFCSCLF